MITVKILINSVEKVKKLSSVITEENINCELVEGVHILDGRSIMGIFSLDLNKPIQLNIHSDDQSVLNHLKEFMVEEN